MLCGSKDERTIIFNKGFFFSFFIFFIFFILFARLGHLISFGFIYSNLKFLDNFIFRFKFDIFSLYFLLIVSFVTCLVLAYREVYIESYMNYKFLIFTYFFFSSIIILSCSGSPISLMVGWDFLGVSSILLVMFYCNKTTFFNSVLTMYFNRLGDVFLIFSISIFLNLGVLMIFSSKILPYFLVLLLVLCSFTKGAQFPFSSWLPAAISAPTPISAMVHSSTLVTAGIWLIFNIEPSVSYFNLTYLFSFFSILSFILGGLMANLEYDFKKLIAFSTLSQISLILVFVFLLSKEVAISHMIFHALFKSSLFCFCGILFISFFSDQNFFKMEVAKNNFLVSCFTLSIFSMTGLIFSSSFFRKDIALEFFLSGDFFFFSFFLFSGSLFTLMYCRKIFIGLISKGVNFSFSLKKFFRGFLIFFILTMVFRFTNFKIFNLRYFNFISLQDLLFLNVSFIIFTIFNFKLNYGFFTFSNLQISFMKYYTFSIFRDLFKIFKDYFYKDDLFFHKFLWSLRFSHSSIFNFNILNLFLFFIFIYFCFFSLKRTWHWRRQGFKAYI